MFRGIKYKTAESSRKDESAVIFQSKKDTRSERENPSVRPFGFFGIIFLWEQHREKAHATLHSPSTVWFPTRTEHTNRNTSKRRYALRWEAGTAAPQHPYRHTDKPLVTLPNNHKPHDYLETAPKHIKETKSRSQCATGESRSEIATGLASSDWSLKALRRRLTTVLPNVSYLHLYCTTNAVRCQAFFGKYCPTQIMVHCKMK